MGLIPGPGDRHLARRNWCEDVNRDVSGICITLGVAMGVGFQLDFGFDIGSWANDLWMSLGDGVIWAGGVPAVAIRFLFDCLLGFPRIEPAPDAFPQSI